MVLRPIDLLVTLKLAASGRRELKTQTLADELGIGLEEAHTAAKRSSDAHLLARLPRQRQGPANRGRPANRIVVNRPGLLEFLVHGVRYVFIPERGKVDRGVPTGSAASPLREIIHSSDIPSVWPDARGEVRGETFSPLHPAAVGASRTDTELYELLTLVDAMRGGSAREREIAAEILHRKLANGE